MSKQTAPTGGSGSRGARRKDPQTDGLSPSESATRDEQQTIANRPTSGGKQRSAAASSPAHSFTYNNSNGTRAEHSPMAVDDPTLLSVGGLPISPVLPTTAEYAQQRSSRMRRLQRFGVFLLLIALLAESAWLAPFTDGAANAVPRQPDPVPFAEVQPYGVNTFLQKEVDSWKKDKTMQMAQDLGVGWIKQQFPWADIEYSPDPDPKIGYWDNKNGQSAWTKYDNILALAQQYGLRVIARIDSAPLWSHPDNPDPKAPPDANHMADFGAFVQTFVSRYKGSVAAIQVWNEPNLKGEWVTGNPVNAAEYTDLLKVAYTSAKSGNPDVIVLAAPLATNNESLTYAGNLNELDYLQGMYDAGAKAYFDAMSANAYGTTYTPEDPPSRDKLNFRRVELLHDVMVKNGDSNKAVWFNEYGWNASPPDITDVPWGRVTAEQQGDYTVRGIQYARQNWPWAGVFTIWYLRQVGDIPRTASEYYFGLLNTDFVKSDAYVRIQAAATALDSVAGPGVWGPLTAPVTSDTRWSISLGDVPGGMYLSPSALGITLDLPFKGTDVSVQLVPPQGSGAITSTQTVGARYYVTIDGSSRSVSSDLPRDANGDAYIQVSAMAAPTNVVVANGVNAEFQTGQHTLQIRVAPNPTDPQNITGLGGRNYAPLVQSPNLPGIGVLTVEAHRSYILFALLTLALIVAGAYLIVLLRRPPAPLPGPDSVATGR